MPAFDCIHGFTGRFRYLVEGHLFAVMHDQDGAMVGMEDVHDRVQFFGRLSALEYFMGQRLGIGYGVGKGDVILVIVEVREDRGSFLLYMIKGGISGNSINPRLEGAAFLEAFYVLPRLEESVLGYVLGVLIVMRILPGEVEDGLHVPVHQFSEGDVVAGFRGFTRASSVGEVSLAVFAA